MNVNVLVFHKMCRNLKKLKHLNAMICKSGFCLECIGLISEMKSISELILTGNIHISNFTEADRLLKKMQPQLEVLGEPSFILTAKPRVGREEIAKYFNRKLGK